MSGLQLTQAIGPDAARSLSLQQASKQADTLLHPPDILLALKDILLMAGDILLPMKDILLKPVDTLLTLKS